MDYNVFDYGASGDGKKDDAKRIQKAIDVASSSGGGRVVLDGCRTFLSSSIILKKGVDLHVVRGSRLLATPVLEDYMHPNEGKKDEGVSIAGTPVTLKPSYAFIYALDADDIAITGDGEIDGNCYAFVKRVSQYYVTGDFYPRPTMIYLEHCSHVTVRDITLRNAPFWTLHPAGCYDVLISNIRILNPLDVANSDGIDPDHSSNVRILGCHVEAADDCICLKSSAGNMEYGPTENIVIADCTLKSTSAALKIGTEGTGDFKNIVVHGVTISGTNRGISIQIRDQGSVRNAFFSDITIETRRFAPCWWGTAEPIAITSIDRVEGKESGSIENIVFENIVASGENGVFIHGNHKVRNIRMRNVRIELKTVSKWEKGLYDYRPGEGTEVLKKGSSAYFISGVDGLLMEDCSAVFSDNADGAFSDAVRIDDSTDIENRAFRTEGLDD